MAKKVAKKSVPSRGTKKSSANGQKAKPGTKKSTPSSLAPVRVTTGKGASPEQVGHSLVELFNAGKITEVEKLWWSPSVESVEGIGMAWRGRKAVEAKNAEWYEKNEIRSASAEGPFVGASGFAVKFRMDVEARDTGKRTLMEEVGVYTVQNGKIIREEFMYGSAKASSGGTTAGPATEPHRSAKA